MSIASEITRLQTAKSDIKTAIETKGVTVPSSATIDTYDDYVSQISGGGGTSYETELMGIIDRTISGNLTIPSGVTSIGAYAFYKCSNLSSIDIPNSVTTIDDYAFYKCSSLTSVIIPNSVTSIGTSAFQYCNYLTSIDIPNSVTSIGTNAFRYCMSLTSVTIPSGVTRIGQSTFNGCKHLTSITVNAITPPTLGSTNVFSNTNDCPIYVPAESLEAYKSATNWSTYASRIQAKPNS